MAVRVLVTTHDGTTSELSWLEFERMIAMALGVHIHVVARTVERNVGIVERRCTGGASLSID